jgi:hypothetical protein
MGASVKESGNDYNKLIFHPLFSETIEEINNQNITIPPNPAVAKLDFDLYQFPKDGKVLRKIEENNSYKLDPTKGDELIKRGIGISAYDESLNKFAGLEGSAYLFSHSLVIHGKDDYIPSCFISFYFYTRSKAYSSNTKYIRYSHDPESDSKKDYLIDRERFITKNAPKNSILFIDGPLIGGQASSYTIKLNEKLLENGIIPLFFVKNSNSDLVANNIDEFKDKYNSDMDWAHKILKVGERTCFFEYVDQYNPKNAKVFCYIKPYKHVSPQRVEFHSSTFMKHKNEISMFMDLIYYLVLAQGDYKNPQLRTIAIAEKYARETLRLIDLTKLMKNLGIISTINQERFGW